MMSRNIIHTTIDRSIHPSLIHQVQTMIRRTKARVRRARLRLRLKQRHQPSLNVDPKLWDGVWLRWYHGHYSPTIMQYSIKSGLFRDHISWNMVSAELFHKIVKFTHQLSSSDHIYSSSHICTPRLIYVPHSYVNIHTSFLKYLLLVYTYTKSIV